MLFIFLYSICLLFASLAYIRRNETNSDNEHFETGIYAFFSIVLFLFSSLIFAVNSDSHFKNLATLRTQFERIQILDNRVKELSGLIKDNKNIDNGNLLVVANADSPIRTIVDQLAQANKDLANARCAVVDAKRDIEIRKVGFLWPIVWIYGDK